MPGFEQGASLCFPYRKTWPLRAKLAIAPAGRNGIVTARTQVQQKQREEDYEAKGEKEKWQTAAR